ncbi:MAG TPA: YfcE family phosphodiesterase [Cytophagales bacterium]|nr:YfcE family phosphodiesterase [Cytophagales bacterium]HAA18774.1 YfcE family phosphodiesterase [Cytophagales bacterium]HAP64253.1 YfcE family phosphodiesterase [Cytophagales bacterium]
MKKIGLISDTHSHLDEKVFGYFEEVDEIWHAGDIGDLTVANRLAEFKPFRAVWGNIDDAKARTQYPENDRFTCEGLDVWITHIGGYPGRYDRRVREEIKVNPPGLFICGHSHILKVMPDKNLGLLHMNPGAAGVHGFHKIRTMLRFTIQNGKVEQAEVIELGLRGKTK